jgi:signal transduction histidine kinase
VPAVEAIGEDPQELRRSLRDLVAASMLPAIWTAYDPDQVAQSVTEVLVRMIGLEFAYMSLRWGGDQPAIEVARVCGRIAGRSRSAIRGVLAPWLDRYPPAEVVTLADPFDSGSVRVAFVPVPAGEDAMIAAASHEAAFPTAAQRLLLEVTANQAAIAIRRWQAEHALQRLNETLEERVAAEIKERMKIEEAFRQAQKMEAVGQLTGGIAHDFNNLLAGIVGSLDLMQTRIAQGRTETVERYARAAMSSAQRAAALTHRLLAFSRRQPLDPKPVNANQLVASMEDLLRRTIGPLHALEIVTAGGLWTTLCDPNQLESAILNLAINARDAMPNGGKLTIETCNAHLDNAYVAAQRDVTPGQYVCICVTDSGTGMPPDVIARAFEPFFTTKPLGQGTGLGLSMVYGFAKQSEGHLRIYSEVGQGTTIKIYLPRHRGTAAEEESRECTAEVPRSEAGETVLVVEDEPVIRDLIVEVLQDLGYRALEAPDGPSGLKVLHSRERVDLLVTDVGLPGINGRQLADQARVTRPGLKVLFITGYAENATLANGFLDPGMEMITKPFAIEALATRIRSMIQGS